MSKKRILKSLAYLLKFASLIFLIPIPFSIIFHEEKCFFVFIVSGGIIFLISRLFLIFVRKKKKNLDDEITFAESLVVVALLWLIVTLISALPFFLTGQGSYLDSWYETMSAWTTTGFSLFNPDVLPKTLILWRSLMAFIGGIGIVSLAIGGLIRVGSTSLARAEGFSQKIRPNILNSVKVIWKIYLFFLVLGTLALTFIAKIDLFRSFNYAAVAISTAGFTTDSFGIIGFHSLSLEIILVVLMILGATSFYTHHLFFSGKIKKIFRSQQFRLFFILLIIGIAGLLPLYPFRKNIFQVVSALTTSGFNTAEISYWDNFSKSILIFLMLIGGASGSTAGGLKLSRMIIVSRAIITEIRKIFQPHLVIVQKVEGTIYRHNEVNAVLKFVLLFLIILGFSTLVFIAYGYPPINSLFQTTSAMATTGLSVISNYRSPILKLTIIFDMFLGRLEIWAIIILIISIFKRKED